MHTGQISNYSFLRALLLKVEMVIKTKLNPGKCELCLKMSGPVTTRVPYIVGKTHQQKYKVLTTHKVCPKQMAVFVKKLHRNAIF